MQQRPSLVEESGVIPRLAEAAEKAKEEYRHDQGRFQREHGEALLAAWERIPKGSSWPANLTRLPDENLNALDDQGQARGFLKVNPDQPGNLYEAFERPAENRPAERLVKAVVNEVNESVYDKVKRELAEKITAKKTQEWADRRQALGRDR